MVGMACRRDYEQNNRTAVPAIIGVPVSLAVMIVTAPFALIGASIDSGSTSITGTDD
jgi:hypothetical protein